MQSLLKAKPTKFLIITLALALFFCFFCSSAFAADVKISTVSSSTSLNKNYDAFKAADNNFNTYWIGGYGQNFWWIALDLGKPVNLSSITIVWEQSLGATDFSLQASNDSLNWINLYSGLSSLGAYPISFSSYLALSGTYRYLRIYINKAHRRAPAIRTIRIYDSGTDVLAPTGSIKINNGAIYTSSRNVTLNVSAQDSAGGSGMGAGAKMCFGEGDMTSDDFDWSGTKAYSTTAPWVLFPGDGRKDVYVRFSDAAGNWCVAVGDSIILDTSLPIKPVVTDDGASVIVNDRLHASWSASDNLSGINEYQYKITQDSTSGSTVVDWISAGTDTEVTKTGLNLNWNKTYYFSVKAKNGAGLWSDIGYSDGIKADFVDSQPPVGSIKINDGAAYTKTALVVLMLSAQDAPGGSGMGNGAQMKFSNDNLVWSIPENYTATQQWTLPPGEGEKMVYVKFKDMAGNWSQSYLSKIILDKTPPAITVNPLNTPTNKTVSLSYSVVDNLTPQGEIKITGDDSPYTKEGAYSITLDAEDLAGNRSIQSISFTIDKTLPVIIITSPLDGASVVSPQIQLVGAVDGVVFSEIRSLQEGENILSKTVADESGNTATVSIKVTLDSVLPTGTVIINNDSQYVNSTNVILTLSALDTGSGMGIGAQMQFSNDNLVWSAPENYVITKAWTINSGDGQKTVYVKFKDVSGNWSEAYSDAIILDATPPAAPQGLLAGAEDGKVTLSWTQNAEVDLAGYNIYRSVDGETYSKINSDLISAAQYQDGGLTGNNTYFYKITSLDKPGNESVFSSVASAVPAAGNFETEPNNSSAAATLIQTNIPIKGRIDSRGDYDYFKIAVPQGGKFFIDLTSVPANINAGIKLYSGTSLVASTKDAGYGSNVVLEKQVQSQGDYYISIFDFNHNASSPLYYQLNVNFVYPWVYDTKVSEDRISPANNDGYFDSTRITASITANANWVINIKDSAGIVKRSFNGTGAGISQIWDGKDQSGNVLVDGAYTYNITASDPLTGAASQEVSGVINVDNSPPTASFAQPVSGVTISGIIAITGTADDSNFGWWQLSYGSGTSPTSWNQITYGSDSLLADGEGNAPLIYSWNTRNYSNGNYVLRFKAYDDRKNIRITDIPIVIRNISLSGIYISNSLISPNGDGIKDSATISASINFAADWIISIKDALGVVKRTYTGNGIKVSQVFDGKDAQGSVLPDGVYACVIGATEQGTGLVALEVSRDIKVDNTPPALAITHPDPGAKLGGIAEIRGLADDQNFSSWELRYGIGASPTSWVYLSSSLSPLKIDVNGNAPVICNWNTSGLISGDYVLRLQGYDSANNTKTVTISVVLYNVSIANYSVSRSVFSPNNDNNYDTVSIIASITTSATWTINIKDSAGVIRRVFTNTGVNINQVWDGKDASGNVLSDGVYTYTINATDGVTGASAQTVSGNVQIDNTPPVVNVIQPISGCSVSGISAIKALADDLNFSSWELRYASGTAPNYWYRLKSGSSPLLADTSGNIPVFYNWNTSGLSSGNYALRLKVSDSVGNVRIVDVPIILYNIVINRASSYPSLFSPNNDGKYDSTNITASITVNSNWTLKIKDPGGVVKRIFTGTGTSITQAWDGKDASANLVADGVYTYVIDAVDPVTGSSAQTVTGTVQVDNTAPQISITQPISGTNLAGISAIYGLVEDSSLDWWELSYGYGTAPVSWYNLTSGSANLTLENGNSPLLWNWDTKNIPNGDYVLRLCAYDDVDNMRIIKIPVVVQNEGADITELAVSPATFTPDGLDDDLSNDFADIAFKLSGDCFTAVRIFDSNMNLVRTLWSNVLHPSQDTDMKMQFQWDGKNDNNVLVRNGQYKVVVTTAGGANQASVFIVVNDRPIFNDFSVKPGSFSPDGNGVDETANLSFTVSEESDICVEIYNSHDVLVRVIVNNFRATAGQKYSYVWDGKDNSNQVAFQGRYYFKVNAEAITGSKALPLKMNVFLSCISNITVSQDTFNPYEGQTTQINYRLVNVAKLNINIYDAQNNLVRNLINNQPRDAGEHGEIWDGKSNSGSIVCDGYYYFIIEDSISGLPALVYDPSGTGGEDLSHSIHFSASDFDTFKNCPSILTYRLAKPAKINIKVRLERYSGPAIRVIKYEEPVGSGEHQSIWDGRDELGNIISFQPYTLAVWGYSLNDNVIVITGGRPDVSQITVAPIKLNPITNRYAVSLQNYSTVSYRLSRDSNVTIAVYDANNNLVRTLLSNVLKYAGINNLDWDGKNDRAGVLPNGYYRIEIQAVKDNNYSDIATAHIEVVY
ncbi:MAG: gliding motility-associated C-terminal domain-containing protein [Candidatus Omnitrophica bacterium]|nr:gliding motility-associated C-terminal domain-containing protein [Candidatus Omnitrophota bacterium]